LFVGDYVDIALQIAADTGLDITLCDLVTDNLFEAGHMRSRTAKIRPGAAAATSSITMDNQTYTLKQQMQNELDAFAYDQLSSSRNIFSRFS
jgi:hypothetical protein